MRKIAWEFGPAAGLEDFFRAFNLAVDEFRSFHPAHEPLVILLPRHAYGHYLGLLASRWVDDRLIQMNITHVKSNWMAIPVAPAPIQGGICVVATDAELLEEVRGQVPLRV